MSSKVYFPGLNGVRFIAVFIVIVDHLELFKGYLNIKTLWPDSFSSHLGQLGVTIFFVLSGYLITYLLLIEKKEAGRINIMNFYIRRILRIWPLYFILMILGFFILPHISFFNVPIYESVTINFWEKFCLYFFFLANAGFVFYPVVAFAGVLWSVAVEEQFYLMWPHIIKKAKNVFIVLLICLFIYTLFKIVLYFNLFGINDYLPSRTYSLLNRTRFSAMIIGGLGALIVFSKNVQLTKYICSIASQLTSYLLLIVLFFNLFDFTYFELLKNEFTSVVIGIIIINISSNNKSLINLENKYLNFLGKISYGMYIYHSIAAVVCIKIFKMFHPETDSLYYVWSFLLFLCTLLLTIFVSHLSYKYIEERILKRKTKFSTIQSGDLVINK